MPGTGDPYCSLVNVATAADGSPVLLISGLAAAHQEHPGRSARVADAGRACVPAIRSKARAMMIAGRAEKAGDDARAIVAPPLPATRIRRRSSCGISGFCVLQDAMPRRASGRGIRPHRDLEAPRVPDGFHGADERASQARPGAVAHMNEDHVRGQCALCDKTARRGARRDGDAPVCDPDGARPAGSAMRRCVCAFPERVTTPAALRKHWSLVAKRGSARQLRAARFGSRGNAAFADIPSPRVCRHAMLC